MLREKVSQDYSDTNVIFCWRRKRLSVRNDGVATFAEHNDWLIVEDSVQAARIASTEKQQVMYYIFKFLVNGSIIHYLYMYLV